MSRLVFFLEERSARKFLLSFLPKIGFQQGEYEIRRPYEGKRDLLKYFAADLRNWRHPNDQFLVLVDQDMDDCQQLKEDSIRAKAREKCREQAKKMRVRIACWELEAWYLGDISALRCAYPNAPDSAWNNIQQVENPDAMRKPSDLLNESVPGFRKAIAAEKMGEILGRKCVESVAYYDKGSANCNCSASFRCFAQTMADFLRELRGK